MSDINEVPDTQTIREELLSIINHHMGENSKTLFHQFYRTDTIEEQYKGALDLFSEVFGRDKAAEHLMTISEKIIARDKT